MECTHNRGVEFTIADTEGGIRKYYVVCRFETMNKDYIALVPQSGENIVELFRFLEDENGNIDIADIVSDMELESVVEAYRKISNNEVDELLLDDDNDNTIVIRRDDGSDCVCNIVSLFEYDSKDYIALMPLEPINNQIITDEDLDDEYLETIKLEIVLYGYSVFDDNRGASSISLIPIPVGQYPSIQARFMDMVMEDDGAVMLDIPKNS